MRAYGAAEKEAKKANAQLPLAEIYTEWAPLTGIPTSNGAVEKLELAVQISSQDPEIGPSAKRNLALALFKRGWKLMQQGKAGRRRERLRPREPRSGRAQGRREGRVRVLARARAARLGRAAEAAKTFKHPREQGQPDRVPQGCVRKAGSQFFAAYAKYEAPSGAAREQACQQTVEARGRDRWHARESSSRRATRAVAYDHWQGGSVGAAQKAIALAEKSANGRPEAPPAGRPRVDEPQASKTRELESLSGSAPEALVNLGIVYDRWASPREAYDAWTTREGQERPVA